MCELNVGEIDTRNIENCCVKRKYDKNKKNQISLHIGISQEHILCAGILRTTNFGEINPTR